MKFLYHHRIGSRDGQAVHVEEIVSELRLLNHTVSILEPHVTGEKLLGSESKAYKIIKRLLPKVIYEILEILYTLLDFARLVKEIRKCRPDVIYERFNLFTPSGTWAKKVFSLPLISEVNAPLLEERSAYGGVRFKSIARWSQQYVWRNADCVITVSNALRDVIVDHGVSPGRIEVMQNGVNLERFVFDQAARASIREDLKLRDKFVLGFTGFMREWHQLDKLLDLLVLSGFEDTVVLLVGDGPAVPALRAHAFRIGVQERLLITGVVQRGEISGYISAFDVAIQSNVTSYASPLKMIEYLALGRAIVAPRTANIEEIVTDGVNAVLFEGDSRIELQAAIEKIREDDELRRSLERQAAATITRLGLIWASNASRVASIATKLTGCSEN